PKEGINIQLFFMDDTSNEPVITSLARNLNIDFSICYGKLENFKDNILGSLVISIDKRDLERVMQFLKERNVYLEVLDERSN
ncbi:MAG: methionine ABC transporter ATP-binding protein, partial [Erysipelotrichaceae bacterium]|nr:methionine ABC transporter ATP-binding protein [Erysipelotrichaceae bacterium]